MAAGDIDEQIAVADSDAAHLAVTAFEGHWIVRPGPVDIRRIFGVQKSAGAVRNHLIRRWLMAWRDHGTRTVSQTTITINTCG